MANEVPVNLIVGVVAAGQESLIQINKELSKMNKSTEESADSQGKQSKATDKANLSLLKMYPQLQTIAPLLTKFGLGGILGAGAIGFLAVELLKLAAL